MSCFGALALGWPTFARASDQPSDLARQVVALVRHMRSQGLIRAGEKTSWFVYDFTTRSKLVAVNEDIPRQAASMIKPLSVSSNALPAPNITRAG